VITFEYDGRPYRFDNDVIDLREARYIKRHTMQQLDMWDMQVQLGDVDALICLVVLAVRRAGGKLNFEDVPDDLDVRALKRSMVFDSVPDELADARQAADELAEARAAAAEATPGE
jgi:hypothetical protein